MSNDPEKDSSQSDELELSGLAIEEQEIEVLSNEDARAIPEVGASVSDNLCCTVCGCSSV